MEIWHSTGRDGGGVCETNPGTTPKKNEKATSNKQRDREREREQWRPRVSVVVLA